MLIQHSLMAQGWDNASSLIRQRLKIKILELAEQSGLHYSIDLNVRYNILREDLVGKLSQLGQIWSADTTPCLLTDKYILVPTIVDSGEKDSARGYMFEIWTKYEDRETISTEIKKIFEQYETTGKAVRISWALQENGSDIQFADVHNVLQERLFDEAYPYLNKTVNEYIKEYLASDAPVLIAMGKPGTGKTRLIRYILQTISGNKGRDADILYTMDEGIFGNDKFFLRFLTNGFDAMVLEDIDLNLKARANGNKMMHKLLGGADGLIRNKNKKIILSTNITNISDIDEALMRKGRCFDKMETRALTAEEANILLSKIKPSAKYQFTNKATVSEVYQITKNAFAASLNI